MAPSSVHPRSIWSPHRDSGCVQVCKSLLQLRGEDWLWVNEPREASWIVIDASRPVDAQLEALRQDVRHPRYWIALAKNWSEVPSPHWAFFKLPLTPRSFFPWINKNLGLPASAHLDKDLALAAPPPPPASRPWEGQWIKLKRWPNLTAYPGLPLQLVKLCRQMLVAEISHEQLRRELADQQLLQRLLGDAWAQGNLQIVPAPMQAGESAPASVDVVQPKAQPAAVLGLFQRFLNRFR